MLFKTTKLHEITKRVNTDRRKDPGEFLCLYIYWEIRRSQQRTPRNGYRGWWITRRLWFLRNRRKKLFQEEGDELYQMMLSGPMQLGPRLDHWSGQNENLIVEGLRRE